MAFHFHFEEESPPIFFILPTQKKKSKKLTRQISSLLLEQELQKTPNYKTHRLEMPWNRDKRRHINDGFFDGKKLRKGGHGNELGPVMRGGGGRDRGYRPSWKMLPWPHKKYPPLGRGYAGPYGGMLPGPDFYSGEDIARQNHRKLDEKWGVRSRRIEEGYMHGRGPMPLPGYPPRPPLPEFLHAPRRRNTEFQKLRRNRRGRDKIFGPVRPPHPHDHGFGPQFDLRQPHPHHDPCPPYHHGGYPAHHGRYPPEHGPYLPYHGGYPANYGGYPDFGRSMTSLSTESLFGPYTDDGSRFSYLDDPEEWGYYSGGEEDYPRQGSVYNRPDGHYDRPPHGGPYYADSNRSTTSLRNRFIGSNRRERRY